MEHEAMMPVIHAQITAIAFPFIRELQADNASSKIFPGVEVFHSKAHVAEFCDSDHSPLLKQKCSCSLESCGRSMLLIFIFEKRTHAVPASYSVDRLGYSGLRWRAGRVRYVRIGS